MTMMSSIIDCPVNCHRTLSYPNNKVKYFTLLLFLFFEIPLNAQDIPSEYIINSIEFTGNEVYSNSNLLGVIVSKETDLSTLHEFLKKYDEEAVKNPYTPSPILRAIKKSLMPFGEEYSMYDKDQANNDELSISNFYNKNGFHQVEIGHEFYFDTLSGVNILNFNINEGKRFRIGNVHFHGLESLDNKLSSHIDRLIKIDSGDYFQESRLLRSARNINLYLKNNGYYFSKFEISPIVKDTNNQTDFIEVDFNIGRRVKFGDIKFFDILSGQKRVVGSAKENQLAWRNGDWVSHEKIEQSSRNLLGLGTFNYVSIDTSSYLDLENDSLLNFVVVSRYRKQMDWELSMFYNRTENSIENGGFGGEISNKNMFGNAEYVFLKTEISGQDPTEQLSALFDDLIGNDTYSLRDKEFKISVGYSNPSLFAFDWQGVKAKANVSLEYSTQQIKNFFVLNSVRLPFIFPLSFKKSSDVDKVVVRWDLENQTPTGFDKFVNSEITGSVAEKKKRLETLYIYREINDFSKQYPLGISSNVFGISVSSDSRNNFFSPTKGMAISLSGEFSAALINGVGRWAGLAEYFKLNFNGTHFTRLTSQSVLGIKIRAGRIFFGNSEQKYIPLEKQFFAGGANSVRAWQSRELRYTKQDLKELAKTNDLDFLQKYIGNQGILEGSFEYRYSIRAPGWTPSNIKPHIESLGITLFLDYGNAFGWLLPGEDNRIEMKDLLEIAVAYGIGFRYDTMVGPIRFDVAWPWIGPPTEKPPVFHIGLGHAF
jgi:outer membrane protein assembly factor BamA